MRQDHTAGIAPARLLLAVTMFCSGCAGGSALDATSVLSYDQCRGLEAGLTRVQYADVAGIRGGTLLDMTQPEPDRAGGSALLLVAISRGRQPTPGYAMTLANARRHDDTAVITVNWQTPASGAVLPQLLTHPCLVVGLPRGSLARVEAVDQSGDVLGSLDLAGP